MRFISDSEYPQFRFRGSNPAAWLIVLCVSAALLPASMQAQQPRNGPDRMNAPPGAVAQQHPEGRYGSGESGLLDFYQRWISPARGTAHCPMHPSCSQYAKQAFEQLPWYEAYVRTLERLLRCGNDLHDYPVILVDGEIRWLDPIPQHDVNTNALQTPTAESALRPPVPRSSGARSESR